MLIWNRLAELRGLRLYTNPDARAWLLGQPAPRREEDGQAQRPAALDRFQALDIAAEPPSSAAWLSLTWRLARMKEVTAAFVAIVAEGRIRVPYRRTKWPHRSWGADWSTENDGPTREWRERATAIWAALPPNDSAIFARPAVTESPRNAGLADRLRPLLFWARFRRRPTVGATNWLQPDNDSYDEHSDRPATNRERRMRPGSSDAELNSWVRAHKAGRLGVSNGKQVESCYVMQGDKAVHGSVRMPAGAIMNCPDRFAELLGSEPDPAEIERRREYWTSLYGTARAFHSPEFHKQELEQVRHIKAGRIRRKQLITPAEQKAILAGPLPHVTYCRPGLPCGGEDIGASFLGGWISTTKGEAGAERWEDHGEELSARSEFESWLGAMSSEDVKALDSATTAANFSEVGEVFGKHGKNAERYGKKILLAANDSFQKILAA